MSKREFKVLFWGYSPQDGKRRFMTHEDKLFVPLTSSDYQHTLTKVVNDVFFGDSQSGLCLQADPIGDSGYVTCKIDITRAKQAREDIRFERLRSLKLTSGLKQLDREVNTDLWAGVAFILQYQKTHMPR